MCLNPYCYGIPSQSTGKARKITRDTSEYKGKYFHVGTQINEFDGRNELEVISELLGKKFKVTVLKDVRVPAVKIVNDKPVMYDNEADAIAAVDTKDCYKITIL